MKTIQLFFLLFVSLSGTALAQSDEKAQALLSEMETALGGWDKLWSQGDVSYTYDYHYPASGQRDLSTERYIFEGEHSWAKYTQHDINVMPGKEGTVVQALVDGQAAVKMGDKMMEDPQVVGGAEFLRRANYFWLTMFYKMDNPGVVATYKGKEKIEGTEYEVVHVTYDPAMTGKEKNDEYKLYLNPETNLVDRFFFSLPAMGVNQPVILMEVDYEEINGLQLPTKRRIYQPGEDGQLPDTPGLVQTLTDVKFGNGFTADDFRLK